MNGIFQRRQGYGHDFVAPAGTERQTDTFAELLLAARRQAWVIVVSVMLGLALGVLHYATTPKTYQAAATVLVEERQAEFREELGTAPPISRNETSMMNQMQILGSLEIAVEVVEALDLANNPDFTNPPGSLLGSIIARAKSAVRGLLPQPSTPPSTSVPSGASSGGGTAVDMDVLRAAQTLRLGTDLRRVGRSFVVEIWYESHDPALATAIVNAYADAYLADGIRANVEAAMRTANWMDDRLAELRAAALEAAEEAERFRLEFGATDQQGLRERESRAEALNDLAERFQARSQEAVLESSFPASAGRVLSRALPPRDPAAPKAWQVLASGIILGLLAAVGIAGFREMRETGFRTGRDVVDALGLPFLGYLPAVRPRDLRRDAPDPNERVRFAGGRDLPDADGPVLQQLMARDRAVPLDVGAPGDPIAPLGAAALLASRAPTAEAGRAFLSLFASLDLGLPSGQDGRIIAVAALNSDDGASHVAANLAHAAACAGRRVILVDADMTGSGLTRRMRAAGAPGTIDVLDGLAGVREAVRYVPKAGHWFLPTGAQTQSGAMPHYMADFATLLMELRNAYDDIIVDFPPLARAPEAKTLLRGVENLLLVTTWGRTSRALFASWLDRETEVRRRSVGVVLNRTDMRRLRLYGEPRPKVVMG
ncbi:MAG: Wzz/FepE/Etk N-terminal domain-containing protein [Pseudomonadota bacterium]